MINKKAERELFKKENVVGFGYGDIVRKGKVTIKGLVVTVRKKVPLYQLKAKDVIPRRIENWNTDVVEVGEIKALEVIEEARTLDRTQKYRPFPMGVSVGHYHISAGTAGYLVHKDGEMFLLSNNHVLANCNKGKIGDPILQPGPTDGGIVVNDTVGHLEDFIKIKFGGVNEGCSISNIIKSILNIILRFIRSSVRFNYVTSPLQSENLVDAAIAKLSSEDIAKEELLELGSIEGVGSIATGQTVKKSGRTTGVTSGKVWLTNYKVLVSYGAGKSAYFVDQILVLGIRFSAGGDSGSVVVKDENGLKLVGLLFAGSDTHTVVNKIENVFDALGIRI